MRAGASLVGLLLLLGGCFDYDYLSRGGGVVVDGGGGSDGGDRADLPKLSYAETIQSDLPIAYYRLDDTSGMRAKDISPEMDDAVFTGEILFGQPGALASDPNPGIRAPGSTSQIRGGSRAWHFDFGGTHAFTLEMWINPAPIALQSYSLLSFVQNQTGGVQGYEIIVERENNGVFFQRWLDDVPFRASAPLLVAGNYTHLVAVYDGAVSSIWINGTRAGMIADTRAIKDRGGESLYLAGNSFGGPAMPATYDEIAVYDVALAPERIMAHYLAAK